MDGYPPYYHIWKSSDGVRYYDPQNFSPLTFSKATATPFFHQLLYPIANFPQRTISRIWLLMEYLAVFLMVALAIRMASTHLNQKVALVTGLLFLFTYAWILHVSLGQIYLFIPLIAMLFYFVAGRSASLPNAILAGILGMSLVLIKPTTIFFFLPFLLLIPKYSGRYLLTFSVAALLVLVAAFFSSSSRSYWTEYQKVLHEHVKMHQGAKLDFVKNEPDPKYPQWEGWDTLQIKRAYRTFNITGNGENGNIFVLVNKGLNVKLPVWSLYATFLIFIVIIFLLFYRKYYRKEALTLYGIALTGFCMYMASEIFSPIHRANYNATQWIFPLLLIASHRPASFRKIYFPGIFIGFLLNSIPIHFMPMQRTAGEYLVFACIIASLLNINSKIKS